VLCPTRLVVGARSVSGAAGTDDRAAVLKSSLRRETDFAAVAVPGAGARCLEDRPRETRDVVLDCVLAFEGPIHLTDPSSRRPELLGASVRALETFETVEQARKFLCARAPPSAEAIEEALREARLEDEAESEEDEETRAARVRTTALAKDDPGYFGFVG
jgi:surfactin synthase thioesterase subunit